MSPAEPPRVVIADPAAAAVIAALTGAGAAARFVGGCVRDVLLGRAFNDIDLATDAEPARVSAVLAAAGIEPVPTGLAHGTVTAVVGGRPVEITTLRRDVETDGRHAVVAFTTDFRADAARRDFTMNALSADPDGTVHDYFGGIADARAGRVRFVGDPRRRLAEDRLRLLRFFRFHAHYGAGVPDPDGLAACTDMASGLPALSAERIRAELLKLLAAPLPSAVWAVMVAADITPWILAEAVADPARLQGLERLAAAGIAGAGDALLRLAALLPAGAGPAVAARLRLSGAETRRLAGLLDPAVPVFVGDDPGRLRRACHRQGAALTRDLLLLDAAVNPADPVPALAVVGAWPAPALPLAGRDLLAAGMTPGPALGAALRDLETWWEAADFMPDRQACLAELKRRFGV